MKAKRLPSGKYIARAYLGRDTEGKVIQKAFTASSAAVAESLASSYEARHKNRIDRRSVRAAIQKFMQAKEPVLSPTTYAGYNSLQNVLFCRFSAFCDKELIRVSKEDIQAIIGQLSTPHQYHDNIKTYKPSSPKTIQNYVRFLSAVFRFSGVEFPEATIPQKQRAVAYIPTQEDIRLLLKASEGTELYIPILLGAFGGMRRSEIAGLTLDDIKGNVVHVHSVIVRDKEGKKVRKQPKTYTSDRYIELSQWIIDAITENGYITTHTPDKITLRFSRLLKKLGLPHFRFHDLRHFYVSYLHAEGVPDSYIIQRTGHSTDNILKTVYRHTLQDRNQQYTDAILSAFDKLKLQ